MQEQNHVMTSMNQIQKEALLYWRKEIILVDKLVIYWIKIKNFMFCS